MVDREREALVGTSGDDRRMQDGEVRGEGLETERRGGAGRRQQPAGIVHGKGGSGRREGVVVEQGEAFAGGEGGIAEQAGGEIGERREI